jgi:hypothetical protein
MRSPSLEQKDQDQEGNKTHKKEKPENIRKNAYL